LEALYEAAQRVRRDDDAPEVLVGDEAGEVELGASISGRSGRLGF
jgi:hypothetical protein